MFPLSGTFSRSNYSYTYSVTIVSRFVKEKVYKNRPVMEIYQEKTDRFFAVGFLFLLNYFRLNTGIESIGASAWIVWPPS